MLARAPHFAVQPDVLLLCERLPACTIDPATVRAAQMLRFLSRFCRVHLACFVDPVRSRADVGRVRALCHDTCLIAPRRFAALRAALHVRPPALACVGDETLAAWIARLRRRHPVACAIACSPAMASYLQPLAGLRRIVDFPTPAAGRAQRRLRQYDAAVAQWCEHALNADANAGATALPNGVDCDDFSPCVLRRSPYPADVVPLLLARPRTHGADADALLAQFVRQVFAPLHALDPRLRLYGYRGPAGRAAWTRAAGVALIDPGADLRPCLAHAAAVLAPAPSDDVLGAMAMQQVVVGSAAAFAGLSIETPGEALAASAAPELRAHVRAALDPATAHAIGRAARARVLRDFGWDARLAPLSQLIQGVPHVP